MDNRRHKHRKKRGSLGRQALGVSFVNSVYQDKGYGGVFPSTDIYSYNAQRVNLDYLGNAYLLPAHYLAPEGISYFQNLFAADGVDWTDVASNWTVAGDCTLTYMGGGVLRVQGVTSSATPAAITLTIPYSDIEGRTFSFLAYAWAANSGEKVGCTLKRRTGGTLAGTNLTVTTTATSESEAIAICSNPVTGNASNRDIAIEFRNDLALSDDFYIKFPGIIEWRTGQDTSKPPMPEDIKCFVPVGPELWDNDPDSLGTGWTNNGDGSFTCDGTQNPSASNVIESSLTIGQTYSTAFTVDSVTAGSVSLRAGAGAGTARSSTGTFYENIVCDTTTNAILRADATFAGTTSGISYRESAPGFYASEYTPANTVSGGVITRGTGTLLHPWHWERIGYSVPLKVKDQYDPFATSSTMALNERRIPTSPDDTKQAYSNVEAFPNLLPTAARVDFAGEWTQTGTGSVTPVGDGTEYYNESDAVSALDVNSVGNWAEWGNAIVSVVSDGADGYALDFDFNTTPTVSAAGYIDLVSHVGLEAYSWYVCKVVAKHVGTGGQVRIAMANNNGLTVSPQTICILTNADTDYDEYSLLVYLKDPTNPNQFRFGVGEASGTNDGGAQVKSVSFQRLSYTTLSDEDDGSGATNWVAPIACPSDNEYWTVSFTLSQGSAQVSQVGLQFMDVVTKTARGKYTWDSGEWDLYSDELTGTVSTAVTNSDGTVTITITGADPSSNTTVRGFIYPAGSNPTTQGTVNVHGDVVLQRVSAAAEPAWNTLRPGDSVTQYVLQQEDSETTWNLFNSATTITGLPDPTGGTGAFSLTDAQGAATSYLSQNNLDIAASAGDTIYYGGWLQKEAANDAYPGIALLDIDNGSAFTNMIADKVNGEVIWDTGQEGDWLVCIDGAVFAALFPDVYPDGANFWLIIAAMTAVSANNYRIDIQPARADAFDGGVDTSAQGTATFFRPFVTKNALFPFFDSIATTSTVTETVQDWSKIFTFLTEASNNVCNAIFSHGYATNLGVPIEPATTQDMATAAVLATGGSASTYPTSWGEVDPGNIFSVVGEGVSPIHPDARYIDLRVNNTTGSSQTGTVFLDTTSTTGISQGDKITISAWIALIAGSYPGSGDYCLSLNERDSGDTFLVSTNGSDFTVGAELDRVSDIITVAAASTDRYRPQIRLASIPNGTDFTIRITLPNSVQQSFLSSVILGQETRTSQVDALRYASANFSQSNSQVRSDFSLGVDQNDIADVGHNVWSVDQTSANKGAFFQADGDFGVNDSSNTAVISDWGEAANQVIRSAITFSASASDAKVYARSTSVNTSATLVYDGTMPANVVAVGAAAVTYPMHIHGLWSIPNGYESSVTLTSDSERYAQ